MLVDIRLNDIVRTQIPSVLTLINQKRETVRIVFSMTMKKCAKHNEY